MFNHYTEKRLSAGKSHDEVIWLSYLNRQENDGCHIVAQTVGHFRKVITELIQHFLSNE